MFMFVLWAACELFHHLHHPFHFLTSTPLPLLIVVYYPSCNHLRTPCPSLLLFIILDTVLRTSHSFFLLVVCCPNQGLSKTMDTSFLLVIVLFVVSQELLTLLVVHDHGCGLKNPTPSLLLVVHHLDHAFQLKTHSPSLLLFIILVMVFKTFTPLSCLFVILVVVHKKWTSPSFLFIVCCLGHGFTKIHEPLLLTIWISTRGLSKTHGPLIVVHHLVCSVSFEPPPP